METSAGTAVSAEFSRPILDRIDFQAVSVWILGFLLVVYLGLEGGGYDPILRDQLGIAVWWGVLLGLAVGALPLNRLGAGSWIALGLLAAYVAWVALSASWSTTAEGTFADLGRVATYLGIFALALSIRGKKGARRMIGAVGSAIVVISVVALLSRLHPAWFPEARETVKFLSDVQSRLAYPLGYWNGVATLAAIGLPLMFYLATSARQIAVQALAAASIPALVLTIYFTFSRGGTAAAIFGVLVFFALAHDRLPKAATGLTAFAGAAILIAAAGQRDALDSGLATPLAHTQGDELLATTIVVCAGVGLIQAGLALLLRHGRRPAWTEPSRRTSMSILAGAVLVAIVVVLSLGASGKVSGAWSEFKEAKSTAQTSARFGSFSSNGRWPYWKAALKENSTSPLDGRGSGSFEAWWAQHGTGGFVHDAHSLYFETLGELGIVGLALLVAFLGWVLVAGSRRWRSAAREKRTQLGAALATCAAFCLAAAVDWVWELAVIPIAFLLIASVLVSAGERRRRTPVPVAVRVGGVIAATAALVAIAIPLGAAGSLQDSQAAARRGDLGAALSDARAARGIEGFASLPLLQEAVLLESEGNLTQAAAAAMVATEREPDQWRAWVIRSRIDAESGRAKESLSAYRRARVLNPNSPLFE
jgi:hypothetical protein